MATAKEAVADAKMEISEEEVAELGPGDRGLRVIRVLDRLHATIGLPQSIVLD